ncbi:hypothetical protein IWQ60_010255, partial [Tieghemiomyces parasiticus]
MHADFRLAELEALSQLEKVPIEYDRGTYRADNPFLLVRLADDDSARRLVRRSILIKEVCEFWAQGSDYPELFAVVKQTPERWVDFMTCSFKFHIDGFGGTRSIKEQVEIINRFSFLGFEGPIDLKNPDAFFIVYEDYG